MLMTSRPAQPNTSHKAQRFNLIEDCSVADDQTPIPFKKYQLDNGLIVLLVPDQNAPLVHVEMTYHVGSAREALGHSGYAHLFEHMMFQGSEHVPVHEHFRLINEAGGQMNGATSRDFTYYYQTVPKNHLEQVLWLEADRLGYFLPALTEKKFENQRSVVKNERKQRVENRPLGCVNEHMNQALYPEGHPYSWPIIGWHEDLDAATLEDIRQFFLRWYAPNNAVLTLCGDFDEAQALAWIDHYFAGILQGPKVPAVPKTPVTLKEDQRLMLQDKVHQCGLKFKFPTVPAYHPDEAALDVLAKILGDGKSAWLYQQLVQTGVAVQVSVSHSCYEQASELTLFALSHSSDPKDLTFFETQVRQALALLPERGVHQDDLQKIKSQLEIQQLHQLTSPARKASIVSHYQVLLDQPNYMASEMRQYAEVTCADVLDVYERYVMQKPAVILEIHPLTAESRVPAQNQGTHQVAKSTLEPVTDRTCPKDFDRSAAPNSQAFPNVSPPCFERMQGPGHSDWITTDANAPLTEMTLRLPGGIDLESCEQSGMNWLTCMMLKEATQKRSFDKVQHELDLMASSIYFGTTLHENYIHVSCMTANLEATTAVLEEMVSQPLFAASDFQRVQAKAVVALKQRALSSQSVAEDCFNRLLFGEGHRYAISKTGTLETTGQHTLASITHLHQSQFRGAYSQVTAFSSAPVKRLQKALAWLPTWGHQSPPLSLPFAAQSAAGGIIYVKDCPDAEQTSIRVGRLAHPYDTLGDYFYANLVNHPLGGYFNSRLNLNLREEKGLTYGIQSSFLGDLKFGVFKLTTEVTNEGAAYACHELLQEIERYQSSGIQTVELQAMQKALQNQRALQYNTPLQKMNYMSDVQRYGCSLAQLQQQNDLLAQVDKNQLNSIIEQEFNLDQMLILLVGPIQDFLPQLKGLGRPVVVLE